MLRLFDSLTRAVEPVEPLRPGTVSMYSCGPTVYRPVHIGNLRSFLLADLIRRVLRYTGVGVTSVMNITDVGHMTDELTDSGRDKMLLAADDEGLSTSEIAEKYTAAFHDTIRAVNISPFDAYPKASDHVPQIVELVAKLLERGHAYEVDGSVYYDVTSFDRYGELSGQDLANMQAGHRLDGVDTNKRNHQDFLLWKAAGPRRVMVFESPWGLGYPGWHIECSAMSMHHLGEAFDLHTAGIDLRFPHHEAEIAQSEGAVGHQVCRMWVHGEHLLMGEAKMAKSSGNVVTIDTLTERGFDPLAYRYLCFTARYRRQFHFSDDALDASATALRRLRERVATLGPGGPGAATDAALRSAVTEGAALRHHDAFVAALCDDLDFPTAVVVLHEALSDDDVAPETRRALVASWDNVLALGLVDHDVLPDDLATLVEQRERARERRDFAAADAIRDRLAGEGVEVIDTAEGTRWVRRP